MVCVGFVFRLSSCMPIFGPSCFLSLSSVMIVYYVPAVCDYVSNYHVYLVPACLVPFRLVYLLCSVCRAGVYYGHGPSVFTLSANNALVGKRYLQ